MSWVISSEPQIRMIGSANITSRALSNTAMITINTRNVAKIRLASCRFPSPLRLATSADMDTLAAINRESPMNLGCVVSPTAATAWYPRELTIKESTRPAKAAKKDSSIAGHAISRVFLISSLSY